MFLLFELVRNKCVAKVYKYVTSYQLKLKKMSAELANLNHCAAPFLSRAAVNLYWYYFSSGLANSHVELHSALNGNDGQRSETDFKIQISVQRCLRECAFVAEAVRLLDTGEGTIRRIFTLSKHFDDLIVFTQQVYFLLGDKLQQFLLLLGVDGLLLF